MNQNKIYSRTKLLTMMEQNDSEVDALMNIFIEVVPRMLDDFELFLSRNEWEKIANHAHKLKSSMRLWDMDSLDEDVIFIETNAREQTRIDEVTEKLNHLIVELQEAIVMMKLELGK